MNVANNGRLEAVGSISGVKEGTIDFYRLRLDLWLAPVYLPKTGNSKFSKTLSLQEDT